jgi:NAD(P)-dependent dehydrogenase (short-subunit alcohol dehydrogenase family)
MYSLEQRVVILTGATGNLGRSIAEMLVRAGARVALFERSPDRLKQQVPGLAISPDHLILGGVDLADEASVSAAVSAVVARFGRVDGLINAVGAWRGGRSSIDEPLANWTFLHEANVLPVLLTSRAVTPHFLAQRGGRIVNVAARAALLGGAGAAAYSATKSAVLRITEAFSAELKSASVNVNAVLPSTIDTRQNRAAMPSADYATWVQPEAIADVILFLVSDAARAIHGAAIPVYGLS